MNREIKFRGKLLHSNIFIEGNLIIARNGNPYIIPIEVFNIDGHHLIIDSDSAFWVEKDTVGQYTGLKDKHGKDIYEGDIVNTPCQNAVIEFELGLFGMNLDYGTARKSMLGGWGSECNLRQLYDGYNREIEVIGNIYENKDLL